MIRKLVSLLVSLALLFACAAAFAEAAPAPEGITVVDMLDRTVELDGPAERIVAITAANVEVLYALGAGDTLVGRGAWCDYPAEALEVVSVESGYTTNIEEIIALEPDLVIMSTMAQDEWDQLDAAGIPTLVIDAQDIEGVYTSIELIGAVVDKNEEAAQLIADMKAAFADLTVAEPTGKTVYFEISALEWGLWTAGPGTFMDEIGQMLGLTNIFADVDALWAQVSQEQVIERNPDYIVTTSMYGGDDASTVAEILGRDGWGDITAVKEGQVFSANSDQLTRPGPRLVDGAKALAEFIGK